MTSRTLKLGAGLFLSLALLVGNTASARTLSMTGEWFQNRGPLVDIPARGGAVFCGAAIGGATGIGGGCVNFLKPLNGGIPGASPAVNVTGGAPANFSITNANAFSLMGGAANRETVPVAGIPTVIQLASQFSLMGPGLTTVLGGGGAATFQKNAWSNDPRQAGRVGAAFTWCPPGGACTTTPLSQTYGAYRAVFQYSGGTNAFGGTMSMMLSDTGVVSIRLAGPMPTGTTSPPPPTVPRVLHQLVGGTTNPTPGPQMGGGGYPAARTITLANGPVHNSYSTSTPCTSVFGAQVAPPGCGVISAQGPEIFTLPGSQNKDFGMPWTTGMVLAKNLPGPVPANDPGTTFAVTGYDNRTPAGAGQITMVAGATSERIPSSNHFTAMEVVTMTFAPVTPALSAPAISALVALMLLAGGYMVRRHFVTES